jgi:DNA-directed RNA polymerase subunit beta
MPHSQTEKRRFRRSFADYPQATKMQPLLRLQRDSYRDFLQKDVPAEERERFGLQAAFMDVFPIVSSSGSISLEFMGYHIDEPLYDERECKERGLNYKASVFANIRMITREKKGGKVVNVRDDPNPVYMGDLPMMTRHGSFIVNGTERVVVSQLHRSPGVLFEHDSGRNTSSKKYLYSARVIPYVGRWLDFEFDQRDLVYFRIDRRRKMLVSILLKAIGYSEEEILRSFYDFDKFTLNPKGGALWHFDVELLQNVTLSFDLKAKSREVLVAANQRIKKSQLGKISKLAANPYPVADEFLYGKRLAVSVVSGDGEIVAKANAEITEELLGKIREAGVAELQTLNINELNRGPYISNTLALDEKLDQEAARVAIYRMLRPGDPPNKEIVNSYLDSIFFNSETYGMSKVGRMKFNRRLRPGAPAMQYRIWIDKDKLPPRGNLDAMAQAVVDAGQMPALEEAREFLRYVAQYSSRSLAENLTEEEARALSKKLQELPHEILPQTTLSKEDIMLATRCLVDLRNGKGKTDDIDSLTNRRVRAVGEFVANHFQQGLMRVDRAIRDRLSRAESEKLMPHELISAKAVSGAVAEFFNGNQLSQFMDQTNPLSEITHKRRISAFGAGGLTRDRVGFEVRDVHPTHYGRVCPIETPEGQNIGLINSMSLCSNLNEYGFLQTYYFPVVNGKVGDEQVCISALEEEGKVIVQANTPRDNKGRLVEDMVLARKDGEYVHVSPAEVDYMDVSPAQITSAAASIIPFLEHDDANRALMGSNMQRQATPCLVPEKPLVGTGVERYLAEESGTVLRARRKGRVSYVDAGSVVVEAEGKAANVGDEAGVDIYPLVKFDRSNQNTAINQRPLVNVGDKVGAGDVLADGAGTDMGELALGQNLLVAFMPWNGYNFEDSILISERVVADQRFASIHIIEEVAHARSTQLGDEEITRDIPHQSEQALRNLDEEGITRIGVEVRPGDILVGKVTPKGERQMTPEEKLLQAVFGEKANDYKDTSMRMPPGASGVVIDVKVFTSEEIKKDAERTGSARAEATSHEDLQAFIKRENEAAAFVRADAARRARALLAKHLSAQALDKLSDKDALKKRVSKDDATNEALAKLEAIVAKEDDKRAKRKRDAKNKFAKGHDLPQGILKTVKVYVAIKRNLQVGDKMAGRHGNKGVVSRVEPVESMPYLRDGTPVDIALNPLGVPSRMNVGQILETHLGLAAKGLGNQINDMLRQKRKQAIAELREFLGKVYKGDKTCSLDSLTDDELLAMAKNLSDGVPFATPVFDGAAEKDIENMLSLAQLPQTGQVVLRDGRSGEAFERPVTVGYMYIMKLHHLVDEKMHARSTGPYSLVTQQPLGGKAQGGGQRFGEMEVWALEAYGAAHTLCEMLTVKSDDVGFRVKMFENLAEGKMDLKTGIPESFNVLVQEIRSMCIDMDFA